MFRRPLPSYNSARVSEAKKQRQRRDTDPLRRIFPSPAPVKCKSSAESSRRKGPRARPRSGLEKEGAPRLLARLTNPRRAQLAGPPRAPPATLRRPFACYLIGTRGSMALGDPSRPPVCAAFLSLERAEAPDGTNPQSTPLSHRAEGEMRLLRELLPFDKVRFLVTLISGICFAW